MAVQREAEPQYTAADIQVLEGLEAVRRRPGMYIGGTDQRGLHHLVFEIADNSIDEAMAGHCDRIWIHVSNDSHVTVRDNGWGIPIDIHPRTDGNFEVASTGINDDSYSVTVLRPNGSTVSNQKRDAPTGCTKPGHVVWGSGRQLLMTCNGSDAIARAQAP